MKDEIRRFFKSVSHAIDGLFYVIKYEKNFRIELLISILVISLMLAFKVKTWEAIVVIFIILWVLVTELINTVFERIVDILKPRIHPYARLIKDIMAGVVLISAIVSIVVGILIFYPYIRSLIK